MSILSSFELLVQPIIPAELAPNPNQVPDPIAVQAYFLLISNLSSLSSDLILELEFITNPVQNKNPLADNAALAFLDVTQYKSLSSLTINSPTSASISFTLKFGETGLFLLQPNINSFLFPDPEKANFEARGTVNITAPANTSLLLSPQVRGTFLQFDASGNVILPSGLKKQTSNIVSSTVVNAVSPKQSSTEVQSTSHKTVSAASLLTVYAQQAYGLPTPGGPLYKF